MFFFTKTVELVYAPDFPTSIFICIFTIVCVLFWSILLGFCYFVVFFFSVTGSHAAKINLNAGSSCLYLLCSRITGMCQQTQIIYWLLFIRWFKKISILSNSWKFLFAHHHPPLHQIHCRRIYGCSYRLNNMKNLKYIFLLSKIN